jgi:proline iminopeptidase
LFPFGWEELLSVLESSERNNILSSYYQRLTSSDTSIQQQAAQAWLKWEMGLSFFSTSPFVVSWDGHQYLTIPSPLVWKIFLSL